MPKAAAGLTARRVETQKAPGLFADGGGLYLQVTKGGARSWIFRYQVKGKRRDMGLGSVSVFSLAEARQKAVAARRLVAEGVDPISDRDAKVAARALAVATATTFKDCAEAYIASMRAGWRNQKHAAQWSTTLETYAYPILGALPVAGVDTGLVCKVLEPIWTSKSETATRLRGRLESVLDYAKARGYRSGENPARWKGHLDHILPARGDIAEIRHHASLAYSAMPAFWPRLQEQAGAGARALGFAILTAARTVEVIGATWSEIDMDGKVWTIPAARMKAGREHRVPLTDEALGVLRAMAALRTGDYVFPGQSAARPLSNAAMAAVLRRMDEAVTPHGFRATFRTWAAEQTAFPDAVGEAALAHTQGKLHDAYQRGDLLAKRRELMAAWAGFVEGRGADVLPLKRRTRG